MFFTEVRTKDDKEGAIIIDAQADEILKEALLWLEQHKKEPKDMLVSKLVYWDTYEVVGEIEYEAKDKIVLTPYEKFIPYKLETKFAR